MDRTLLKTLLAGMGTAALIAVCYLWLDRPASEAARALGPGWTRLGQTISMAADPTLCTGLLGFGFLFAALDGLQNGMTNRSRHLLYLCMAVAAACGAEPPPVDLWLVWVVCEETDGSGSIAFAEWFKAHHQSRYAQIGAVLFESTESRWIEYEAKGSLFLKVKTEGGSGHGAMKDLLGTSAIVRLAEAVQRVEGLEADWRRQGLDQPTALVTSVRAGDPAVPNKLDPTAELVVDMRTTADVHEEALPTLSRHLEGIPHRLEVISACPPGYTAPDDAFIQAFEAVLPGVEKTRSVASNDQFAFTGLGVPAFVFGPGCRHAIHRPNEFVEVAAMEESIRIVGEFLRRWGQ